MAPIGLKEAASKRRKQDQIEDSPAISGFDAVPQKQKRTESHKPATSAIVESPSFGQISKPTATVQASFAPRKHTMGVSHESATVDDEVYCFINRPNRLRNNWWKWLLCCMHAASTTMLQALGSPFFLHDHLRATQTSSTRMN